MIKKKRTYKHASKNNEKNAEHIQISCEKTLIEIDTTGEVNKNSNSFSGEENSG